MSCSVRKNLLQGSIALVFLNHVIGRKIDAVQDIYVQFGDLFQAMVSGTDNMRSRTQRYVSLLSIGNHTGDVIMWCLISRDTISEDHFKVLQMLEESQSEI